MPTIFSVLARLPPGFLIPFLSLLAALTFFFITPYHNGPNILFAAFIVFLFLLFLLISYHFGIVANWLIVNYWRKPASVSGPVSAPYVPPLRDTIKDDKLAGVEKIGIVLAGGGAKGAFQAGTMKAIYQFLAERNALQKVKVISATSIGSWNALFWLADLIAPKDGWERRSAHEDWWRSIKLSSLIAPSWYVPFCRNAFFDTGPWQRQFDDLFGQGEIADKIFHSDIHFYFTRCHVRSGRLECTTNNLDVENLARVRFTRIDAQRGTEAFLEEVKEGVFASMDLPPLFPFKKVNDEVFEDGGVIDNLPVMFAAMESCDLTFVLPLNSDFNAEPNSRSLLGRFIRVMDVRQGALERGSLKTQYLYNELAVLRRYARALHEKLRAANIEPPPLDTMEMAETLKRALARTHGASRLFAICPQRTFVESTINTPELWKQEAAGRAFTDMYDAATTALNKQFNPKHEQVTMCLVESGQLRLALDF